jgi:beta-galactosidase/beta-glucuronidase
LRHDLAPIKMSLPFVMKNRTTAVCLLVLLAANALCAQAAHGVDPINFDWRFAQGPHPESSRADFDDSTWQRVDLPHDWAIAGPFDPAGDPDTGKLPWKGEGWYRKRFTLPSDAKGQRLQFVFDGVMANPTVYLNGQKVASWIYGYNSFWLDATAAAVFGGENVLTVHADTRAHASRWYPGAGIYRKVTMRLVDPIHIPVWGVYVTTPSVEDAQATVRAEIEIANTSGAPATVGVETAILAPDGKTVARDRRELKLAGDADTVRFDFTVPSPLRWDVDHPHLYTLQSQLIVNGREVDERKTTFGIRTFEWTVDKGFFLNGRFVDLQGVNEHHTHGMLGAAFFPRAMERKLEILRDMGFNALRTSHNPDAPEVVEMCDRLGIIVINELYDKWGRTAGVNAPVAQYVDEYAEREVKNFVLRDRNSPSVVIWSIANEEGTILTDRDGKSAEHVARVVSYFKKYDASRPTLMVGHIPQGADRRKRIFDAVDVSGWNYSSRYTNFRQNYPEKAIIYSETASAFGTRGYYNPKLPTSKTDYQPGPYQSNYGLTAAIWADIPEHEFERMRKDRFLCGNFVWTGFDYLGEPTPARGQKGGGPELEAAARSSYFGIIDLAGLPKDAFFLYRSQWQESDRTVHVSPHWNWSAGDRVPVIVYTDGDEAELFLNGKSLGRKAKLDPETIQPANYAFGRTVNATSSQVIQDENGNVLGDHTPDKAVDGNPETRWTAASAQFPQEWQVDFGQKRRFSKVAIEWDSRDVRYAFELLASSDGQEWTPLAGRRSNVRARMTIELAPTEARHLKVRVLGHEGGGWASIREFEVLDAEALAQDPYFDIVDAYRIRFSDIAYEPGELKAVAYKAGTKIGESSVRTAGAPARLELKADRATPKADGMDLCYVTVRLLDAEGNLCPLAMNGLTFQTEGAAVFMGVANGDQMGHDSLTDETHPLFYGQAVAVLRSRPGQSGEATLKVTADIGLHALLRVSFQ